MKRFKKRLFINPKTRIVVTVFIVLFLLIINFNIITTKLFDNEITYIDYTDEFYLEDHLCEENVAVKKVNNFNEYLTLNTNSNIQQDFFIDHKLIQISNIKTNKENTIKNEALFIRKDTLYIIYSEIKNSNNIACGELLLTVSEDFTYEEMIHEFVTTHEFVDESNDSFKTYYYQNKQSNGQDYYGAKMNDEFVITQVNSFIKEDHIEITDISFGSYRKAYYYYLEEEPYIRIRNKMVYETKYE